MSAGAVQRLLDMTVAFATSHQQFGRPIARFQAAQQNLALLAGHTALCRAAGEMAARALFEPDNAHSIAMAKSRAGESGALAAQVAHQVHGAISFTEAYDLQLFSRRIWAWREEFGNEAYWNEKIGRACLQEADGAWDLIVRHGELA